MANWPATRELQIGKLPACLPLCSSGEAQTWFLFSFLLLFSLDGFRTFTCGTLTTEFTVSFFILSSSSDRRVLLPGEGESEWIRLHLMDSNGLDYT
jgi:hypothetical protein